ncbi:MAG: hypothetical protein KDB71_07075 [Mycobacterium sp.]|nr:hypothetical protein [Mycobacterium sp.]
MNIPSEAYIVDDNGIPIGHIDFDKLTRDATLLMYEMAETAGDDAATDRVAIRWTNRADITPDYFGYLAATALSLTVRHVLAPTLDAVAAAGVDLRPGLRAAADDARRDLNKVN